MARKKLEVVPAEPVGTGEVEEGIETRKLDVYVFTNLLGGSPLERETYEKYVFNEELGDYEEMDMLPESEDDGKKKQPITGFLRDADGIYIRCHQIQGFHKSVGNTLKDTLGVKALKSKLDNYCFVTNGGANEMWLAEKPSGLFRRPLQAQTMQGPRVAIAVSEFLAAPVEFSFEVSLLRHKELNWKIMEQIWDYGALKGLLQFRNGGYGKFIWRYSDGRPRHTPRIYPAPEWPAEMKKAA